MIKHLMNYLFLAFGVLMTGIGIVGIFVPGLPTTIFLILALWAFARSCPPFHDWLLHHPRFGKTLRDWQATQSIPRRAKIMAVGSMLFSFVLLLFIWPSTTGLILTGSIMLAVALFIVTRPNS